MDRQWAEDQRRELTALGVPSWAQFLSNYDPEHARLHVWVDDHLNTRSVLVGVPDGGHLERLASRCDAMLSGTHERRPGTPPDDLEQPCAVAIVHRGSVGHGNMARTATRPLGEVVSFARTEIRRLLSQHPPRGE